MRAALALAAVACLAGCAGSAANTSGDMAPAATGLVLTLHFSHYNVKAVSLSGATYATSRRFGPYVVAEDDLSSRDSTVGFVFDPSDEGTAMVCGESRGDTGTVLAQGCDTFDIIAQQVTHGSLTLN
ncbi:MAG TPA: hypothetical protein VF334_20030 [Polyangia bacterium]